MAKLMNALHRCGAIVVFFGIVVIAMLILQALAPLARLLIDKFAVETLFSKLLNPNFKIPIDVISSFWCATTAAYVGLDRTAFTIQSLTTSRDSEKPQGDPEHLKEVIVMSFVVFIVAVILNLFLDTDFGLTPLFAAFGSAVVLYVGGTKAMTATKNLGRNDLDENGIADELEDAKTVIESYKAILKKRGVVLNEDDLDNNGVKDTEQSQEELLANVRADMRQSSSSSSSPSSI